jgi:hypothetical protein
MSGPSHPRLHERRGRIALHAAIIALCAAIGAILSFTRGQDICFDQLNYHYYSAYAYLTDRLGRDVAPAQVMHSYFSPLVYVPFYLMVRHFPPRAVGMALGALHGLNLWLVFVIARIVTRAMPPTARTIAIVAAVAISALSPMAISEFGTSMTDIVISLPVLAGLALLMNADFRQGPWAIVGIVLAGGLLGGATSLKLTGASFAIGLAVAALIGWTSWRHRVLAFLATASGGAIGFAVAGGAWYLTMWRSFGNPVFPYFNTIFRSPDYPAAKPLFDEHFIPHGVLEALSYPFRWTQIQMTTSEASFRDMRFAVLIVLGAIALAMRLMRGRASPGGAPAGRRLIAFIAVAFAIWLYLWSIQRYLIPLELLAGPAIVVLLQWCGLSQVTRRHALAATAAALAIVCAFTIRSPDWGHLGWRKTWYEVNVPPPEGADPIYFLAGEPLSYVVPSLPSDAAAIGVIPWENLPSWGDTVFLRRIHELLADPRQSPLWAVASGQPSDDFKTAIAAYGLRLAPPCVTTKGRPVPLTWCRLDRDAAHG